MTIINSMLFANLLINLSLDTLFDLPFERLQNDRFYFLVTTLVTAIIDLFVSFNTNQINHILPVNRLYIALIFMFKIINVIGFLILVVWLVLTFRKTCHIVKLNSKFIQKQN